MEIPGYPYRCLHCGRRVVQQRGWVCPDCTEVRRQFREERRLIESKARQGYPREVEE